MPCTEDDLSLRSPSSGLLYSPSQCLQSVGVSSISNITGIPRLKLSPVSDCRGHKESNRGRRRGGTPWGDLELQVSGTCCRGGSVPGPSLENRGGRRNLAGHLGCCAGVNEGGMRPLMTPMRGRLTAAYCPPSLARPCGYAGGPAAPLTWQSACRRDP